MFRWLFRRQSPLQGARERVPSLDAAALCNRGNELRALGRTDEAVASYQRAIAARPDLFEAHYNLALVYGLLGRTDDAVAAFRAALELKPGAGEVHYALGLLLQNADRMPEARACFARTLEIDPQHLEARLSIVMSHLPWVYSAAEDPAACRRGFAAELDATVRWFDARPAAQAHSVIGSDLPFALAYQEENNRELMARYGGLCARLMSAGQERQAAPTPSRKPGRPLRVGVASAHLRQQSVWMAITRGWFEALDPARVALFAFDLGEAEDAETAFARARAVRYEKGHKELRQWIAAIAGCELDALLYPDVGMDSTSTRLASLRLAPVQAAAWGHPETTGLPTIDYYLSAELFEPAGAQAHYTERLVTLPGLGCHFRRQSQAPAYADLSRWGVDAAAPLLVCAGTPFKYAPQFDWVLAEIASRLRACQLVFFRHVRAELTARLEDRLRQAFARHGVPFEAHVRFLPWLDGAAFHGVLRQADVYLDTIGFSGFNTALQAVECSLPIVTREGRFLRGRLASAVLKRMGLHDQVAGTEQDYVDLAVRVVRDPGYGESVAQRMDAGRALLYEDIAPVRALEEFLAQAASAR